MAPQPHVVSCTRRSLRGRRGAAAALAAGASLALLAGCASVTDGSGTNAALAGAAVPAAVTSSAAPTLAGLAGRVVTAVSAATSVHLAGDLSSISGLPINVGAVSADVALASGKPTAAAATAGAFSLRYVDGSAWVTLPGSPAATPWTLVSATSSNPMVAMAAGRLAELRTKLAGADLSALLGAASGLREVGPGRVNGVGATQYTFVVDPAAVASAPGVAGGTGGLGTTAVPVTLWLDGSDRPVQVTATPTVHGTATPLTVTLSKWNAPVSITAPPAGQVSR